MTVTVISNGRKEIQLADPSDKIQEAALAVFQEAADKGTSIVVRRTPGGLALVIEGGAK